MNAKVNRRSKMRYAGWIAGGWMLMSLVVGCDRMEADAVGAAPSIAVVVGSDAVSKSAGRSILIGLIFRP